MTDARRTVFITGCSSGIGRAAAELFAERGYNVAATARRAESVAELENWAKQHQGRVIVIPCDVSNENSRLSALASAREAFGQIHILINNAGFSIAGPIETLPLDDARRVFETNVFGAMRLAQLAAPDMRRVGWGRIINVSSVLGIAAAPFNGWYSASKFALEALTETLRFELTRFGIQTASVLPGPVRTQFVENVAVPPLSSSLEPLYGGLVKRLRAQRSGRRKFEVSAECVAGVILRIVESSRLRPHYHVTLPAHVAAWSKRVVSARMMERMVRYFYGLSRAEALEGIAE